MCLRTWADQPSLGIEQVLEHGPRSRGQVLVGKERAAQIVACDSFSVVGERHRRTTDDEKVGHHTATYQAIPEIAQGSLEIGPPEESAVGHAASKSRAER